MTTDYLYRQIRKQITIEVMKSKEFWICLMSMFSFMIFIFIEVGSVGRILIGTLGILMCLLSICLQIKVTCQETLVEIAEKELKGWKRNDIGE